MKTKSHHQSNEPLCGLIIPTPLEAEKVIKAISGPQSLTIQGKPFIRGLIKDRTIVLVVCGVGKANAAHASGLLIERFNPSLLINIGVAGAYPSSGLSIGDIAIAEREIYIDEGLASSNGDLVSIKELNIPLSQHEGNTLYDTFDTYIPPQVGSYFRQGVFATVSTCTGSYKRARFIESQYNALCENMEGAAIAQVASYSAIPFIEVRAVSNVITDRSKEGINKQDLQRASASATEAFYYLLTCL